MDNQHKKITGDRNLTQKEIDFILDYLNEIKALAVDIETTLERAEGQSDLDQRWVSIAKTDFQTAVMALTRAVAQPTTF